MNSAAIDSPRSDCAAQDDQRIDARQLQVNRLARAIGRRFELQARAAAARIRGGAGARIGDGAGSIGVAGSIDELHRAAGQSGFVGGLLSGGAQQPGGAGMRRIGLGDHRVSTGDCSGKIAAGDAVEGKRKIVRPEYEHGP